MKNVYDAIQAMASTTKRKEKESILEDIKASSLNDTFKRVAFLALDPRHNFNIVEYDQQEFLAENSSESCTLDEALDILEDKILNEGVRGNAAKDLLFDLSGKLLPDDQYVLKCIIDRTLRCGVSDKTVNKIWSDLIYIHPYRRCSSFSEKNIKSINLPAISQLKEDGMYVDIVVHNGKVEYRSRQGGYFAWHTEENDSLLKSNCEGNVLMGEALVKDEEGNIMERQAGNGYLNGDDVDPKRIIFSLWDIIPYSEWNNGKSTQPYSKTYDRLLDIVPKLNYSFRIVDTRIVETVDDIIQHFKSNIAQGLEGSVIKNLDSVWKDGTSKDQVKIKVVVESEFEITEINFGTGKYSNVMGSVGIQSREGDILCSVGSGFTDTERKYFLDNSEALIGKIMTVKYNGLVSNGSGKYSLYLPIYVGLRSDKNEADGKEKVEADIAMAASALKIIE